jgi:hypothetical protein
MGFYILPRAENKAATAYQGQGKDTCIVISAMWMNSVGVCQRTSSWTRGLLSPEDLEEYLSTIVPRILQEKSERRQYVYFEPIPKKIRL